MGRAYFNKLDRAITNDQTFGSVKLLADLDGKILGGHILGANAGDLIGPVVYAIRYGLTIKMIAEAMLPYPTMAEAVRWAAAQLQVACPLKNGPILKIGNTPGIGYTKERHEKHAKENLYSRTNYQ